MFMGIISQRVWLLAENDELDPVYSVCGTVPISSSLDDFVTVQHYCLMYVTYLRGIYFGWLNNHISYTILTHDLY